MPKADTLTPSQARYVEVRMSAKSVTEAATQAGISERTARRWEQSPHVAAALRTEQRGAIERASRRAVGLVGVALDGLEAIASATDTPPATKVNAWKAILDYGLRLNEQGDLSDRLSQLEAILHNKDTR